MTVSHGLSSVRGVTGTAREKEVAQELLDLLAVYDLSPWCFTREVLVEQDAVPHSHPRLTLGTFNRGDWLLASYLHEQLHWFFDSLGQSNPPFDVEGFVDALVEVTGPLPVGLPMGARTESSAREHLVVCFLEQCALRQLWERKEANSFIRKQESTGVYRGIYKLCRVHRDRLTELCQTHGLTIPG